VNKTTRTSICALSLALCAGALKADITVDATTDSGQFGTLDLNTGVFTQIAVLPEIFAGLATVNNIVYGADFEQSPSFLYTINQAGAVTVVGSSPVEYFDFGGTLNGLFAIDPTNLDLWSINPATGAASLIGPVQISGFSIPISGFSSNSNILYGIAFGELYTLDTSTGAATLVGPSNPYDALISEGGVLYGASISGTIDTINPATGAPTTGPAVTGVNGSIFGLASIPSSAPGTGGGPSSVPEPESVVLLATVVAGVGLWRLKRRPTRE
jgi:hypothetical protein